MEQIRIDTCFTPEALGSYNLSNSHVVVVDVLRATSAICAAFASGAQSIIPVPTVQEAFEAKQKGFVVAAEREGKKLDFADFGNSPLNFTPERVGGQTVYYSTTNGTQTIQKASGGLSLAIGSFPNLQAVANLIQEKEEGELLIVCSGWKGKFCLEDALFSGALAEILLRNPRFFTKSDAVRASMQLWNLAKNDVLGYMENIAQKHRLTKMGLDDSIVYCFTPNSTNLVPQLVDGELTIVKNLKRPETSDLAL